MAFRQFDINIQDLQTFLAVAECSSFSDAALMMGKSQPAISNRIKLLEEKLQRQLITRDTKSVRLTDEGKRLLTHAVNLVEKMAILHDEFHEKGGNRKSIVRVYSPIMISAASMRSAIKEFEVQNPQITIEYIDDTPARCIQSVIDGKSDVAVIVEVPLPPNAEFRPLFKDNCQAISAADHPLARKKSASLSEILEYPILSPDMYMVLRQEIIVEAEKRDAKITFVPEAFGVTNFVSLLAMASSDMGVAINSTNFIPTSFEGVVGITDIEGCKFERTFGLVTATGRRLSPPAGLFCEHMARIYS